MNKNNLCHRLPLVRRLLVGVVLVLSVAGLSGCLLAAAGVGAAGAVAYVRGELEVMLPNSLDDTVDAARRAVKDLEFVTISERKDALSAVLVVRTALDHKVKITLQNSGKQLTTIKIRVDLIGDEALSRTVLDKIKMRL